MHSSRMRTARSSSHRGFGPDPPQFPTWMLAWTWSPSISPLGVGLDLIPLNSPLGCGPGSDPSQFPPWVWAWIWSPQFPPWVWAWIWSPSISPLAVGLDLTPLNFPLGCGPGRGSPWQGVSPWWGVSPWQGGLLGGSPWQGVSRHALRQTPLLTEWQTPVKI